MTLSTVRLEVLICLAFRHRWIPYEGESGVAGGSKVIRWILRCESGCGCSSNEWRDLFGFRLPGTQREYEYTDEYREALALGHSQAEIITEIRLRRRTRATARIA